MGINCIRVFGALDQATAFNDVTGFSSWNQTYIGRLDTFLNDICRPLGMKVLLNIFNRVGNTTAYDSLHSEMPYQFQTMCLTHDGKYATMRANYLKMIDSLAIRYADNDVLVAYDIMNEGINGMTGDSVTVQGAVAFFNDCYDSLRAHDTRHPITVSSTIASSRAFMNLTDCVDFYDVHVYDENPSWLTYAPYQMAGHLKPVIMGEAMCTYTQKTNDDSLLTALRNIYGTAWDNGVEAVFAWDLSTEDVMLDHGANNTHTLGTGGKFLTQFDMPGSPLANPARQRDVHIPMWPSADRDTLYLEIEGTRKAIPLL
jgi:hypothetical protein